MEVFPDLGIYNFIYLHVKGSLIEFYSILMVVLPMPC